MITNRTTMTPTELTEQAYQFHQRLVSIIQKSCFDIPMNDLNKLIHAQNRAFKRYMRRRNIAETFIEY